MGAHEDTQENSISVREVSESKREKKAIGKGDARYWTQAGKLLTDPRSRFLGCKIQVAGRRESFPLRTANKAQAAAKAAQIFGDVVALGWEAALAKHKADASKPGKGATVGDLIREVSALASIRPASLRGYVATFRRIAADVAGVKANAGRYARCGEGRESWLASVDAVPLARLTPERIEAWKLRFVASRAAGDETKARSARNSANSMLRMGKGLFAKRIVRLLADTIELPSPLPFDGVSFFKRQSMRYVSTMDVQALLRAAGDELARDDVEAFKALVLCLCGGLRRNEADKLRWRSIDFTAGCIQIQAEADFAPKAETSLGDVPLDSEVCSLLRGLRAKEPKAEYVLAGDASKVNATWAEYRAESTFTRLAKWLRAHGVNTRAPLHTLRKEAGSLVCQGSGLFAASRFLRHADVAITAQHYASQKERVTVGLGQFLSKGDNIIQCSFDDVPSDDITSFKVTA